MRRAVLALLAGLALPFSARAQDTDTEQMMVGHLPMPGNAEAVRFVQTFGLCAAQDARNQSRLVLRDFPGSSSSDKALYWTARLSNSCVKHREALSFSPRALRGPIAEYYLKRDFEAVGWMPKQRPVSLYRSPDDSSLGRMSADIKARIVLVELGACVAQSDPAGVAALFTTSVTSVEERAAFANLSTALSACLPPAFELKLSKFQLRGLLAEGAYRTAAASKTGPN